jgi:hypothetical protein
MAFIFNTKANIAYKKILGKAHTSNEREAFNEPLGSKFLVIGQNVWAEEVPTIPPVGGNAKVSDKLELVLEPVSGTDNTGTYSAYVLRLDATVPASLVGKKNRLTGSVYQPFDRVGQIIPFEMGPGYQPKPYEGSTAVFPLDASDWYIDYNSGILTQETDNPAFMRDYTLPGSKFECYVYIGKMITEAFGGLGGGQTYNFYDKQTPRVLDGPGGTEISPANGISGDQDGQNRIFTLNNAVAFGSEHIYMNGVLLQAGKDYTMSGSQITFSNSVEYPVGSGQYVDRVPTPDDLLQVSYREEA